MLLDKEIIKEVIEGFISTVKDFIVGVVTAPFEYIQKWKLWREYNTNSKFHQFLVLMGLVYSPTFDMFYDILSKEMEMRAKGSKVKLVSVRDDKKEDESNDQN